MIYVYMYIHICISLPDGAAELSASELLTDAVIIINKCSNN